MAINKVVANGNTLIDLTTDTVDANHLAKGYTAHDRTGNIINGAMSGGGLPSGFTAIATGTYTVGADFTTTQQTVTHNLGVVPDIVLFYKERNVAQTYSMLWAIRSTQMGYRSSAYNLHAGYHSNSTTTVSYNNSNSTTYGVSNLTATTFRIASVSSSYYWRKGDYKWVAIKF